MSEQPPQKKQNRANLLVAAVTGQVGCLTLVIVLAAVLGGRALDTKLNTNPWFTIGLLVVSIPVSLVIMFFVVRKTVSKIKLEGPQQKRSEEDGIGKDS
jgi:F0F1-type ATP synthase assembly protein I